jgi:acyl-lipid omega-6 desaturase (Delta-12 desaturase)
LERTNNRPAAGSARAWLKVLAAYREPNPGRSAYEIAVTLVPFLGLWVAAYYAMQTSVWFALPIMLVASGFLVRLFLIQHDCGHGSFFKNKALNDWVGRLMSLFTVTAYAEWKHSHAMHHASSGNLDHRGFGDIDTLTISEYEALTPFRKFKYRLYRNPIIMLGFGPAYMFLFRNRLPNDPKDANLWAWSSVMGTNLAVAVLWGAVMSLTGWKVFLAVHVPIVVMAATIGVWLFYVQHQFEDTIWAPNPEWDRHDSALYGSSHYDLPQPMRWMTANIGVHHVHHLSSNVPYYRLGDVLKDHPELAGVQRMTFIESLACLRLRLWDEHDRRLVSFSEAKQALIRRASEPLVEEKAA